MNKVYIWERSKVHTVIGVTMAVFAILVGIICDLYGVFG